MNQIMELTKAKMNASFEEIDEIMRIIDENLPHANVIDGKLLESRKMYWEKYREKELIRQQELNAEEEKCREEEKYRAEEDEQRQRYERKLDEYDRRLDEYEKELKKRQRDIDEHDTHLAIDSLADYYDRMTLRRQFTELYRLCENVWNRCVEAISWFMRN